MMRRQVHGILLLDKPAGLTSNGALQRVKRLFNAKKAGHTGSLDPIATGMLPLCFGEATKFSQFLLDSDKAYHVVAKLGVQTNTGDVEGEVIATMPVNVTKSQVETLLPSFLGDIEQVPPMFSALKYQGKPLYELARNGIEVERKPRRISIYSLQLDEFDDDTLTLRVHCSKGTYIRTLVEDISRQLGCGGHVIGLRRLSVASYGNAVMYTLPELEEIAERSQFKGLSACLLPVETTVQAYPAIKLSASASFYLRTGQPIRTTLPLNSSLVRLVAEDGKFLGIGEVLPDGRVKPHRLLSNHDAVSATGT